LLAEFPRAHCTLALNNRTSKIRRNNLHHNSPLRNKARLRFKLHRRQALRPFRLRPNNLFSNRLQRLPCTLARL
jgi:hypothetical protein